MITYVICDLTMAIEDWASKRLGSTVNLSIN